MKEINSLEISFLVKNLEEGLVNSKIQKIKQIDENIFSFELYKQKKRKHLLISDKTLFLTDKNFNSTKVTNFFQILKKYLLNQIIQDIKQHEFDRIVEIETKDYLLILELFGNGNIVLLDKPDRRIITALIMRSWKDRSIKQKLGYSYPPSRINPFKLTLTEFEKYFGKREVVKVLAVDFGFGGNIAREICKKIGIDEELKEIDSSRLYGFIKKIKQEFKELKSINEQLEKDFEESLTITKEEKKTETKSDRIRVAQEEALKKLQEKEIQYRQIGKLLYERYDEVKKQLDNKIKKIIIDDITIEVNPRISVQKNAEVYFEMAKKAKRKIEGLRRSMVELEKKKFFKMKKEQSKQQNQKEWYGKFRWFISSDGFLIVAGKDAQTNEQLIRKHMKENDLVFHTDITGSPFVLIKNPDKKEIPGQTIKEAAEFCGSYSKAWKIGILAVDVYYIKPEQVKKEGGLPTGSFMIYGKREWVRRIPVKITIGVNDKVYYGPEDVVKRKTSNYVIIIPGDTPAHEIGKKIRQKLKIKDEVERLIPYGRGTLT